ncbi:hypothetical protein HWV62_6007 [Athelia sp. TMB]|nr:hypothetical protein HWV62_6007 [Athelia sp. TMB]
MACALVCRNWLQRSRALQFKSINLMHISDHRLSAFARLLRSPVATLAPHVRHISLELRIFHPGHRARTKLARLASLVGIEALRLDVDLEPRAVEVSVAGITPFLQSLPLLRKVTFRSWRHDSAVQLRAIVCACPHLEELELEDIWDLSVSQPGPLQLEELAPPPCLRTIKAADYAAAAHLFPWLLSILAPAAAITTLHLDVRTFIDGLSRPSCGLFLKAVASSLEHLTVENIAAYTKDFRRKEHFTSSSQKLHQLNSASAQAQLHGDIDLGALVRLKTVAINNCTPVIILAILNQISSPLIREISFIILSSKVSWQDMSHLSDLDEVLHRPNFAQLDVVEIRQSNPDTILSDGWIQDKLPLLDARGIVHHQMVVMSP